MNNRYARHTLICAFTALWTLAGGSQPAQAASLSLLDTPLFLSTAVPPMNMLVMGRDHKLYYEAYDDHSDLDGALDGPGSTATIDTKYKPLLIDYYGYFDSYKCYTYSNGLFSASSENNRNAVPKNKKCSNAWSGDFLNYLTMSRMDALRKVLFGGYRYTDSSTETVLERSHVPQDAHSWGKEYTSEAVDGYKINEYSPLPMPTGTSRHLFANTTLLNGDGTPRLRVLTNRSERVWNWLSRERPVAGDDLGTPNYDLIVRVKVCDRGNGLTLEDNCKAYPSNNFKPTGLLQDFGDENQMLFGLLSGSYAKNTSGGVLRRKIGSMQDEVNTTTDGTFKNFDGIVRTLTRLRTTGFGGSYEYDCGWDQAFQVIGEGQCQMWGNPIGEMMYETTRYFAGKTTATSAFSISSADGEESQLPGGSLPVATWDDPYSGRPVCTKPFETVVSDINPSYDSDQVPGTAFGSFSGDLSGLDVSTLGQTIWNTEIGGTGSYFIGQSGSTKDDAPTAKSVSSFGNIRGLAPEEPTKQGSYYSASVAYYARKTDLRTAIDGDQKLNTFAVALASPLPRIEIPVNGRKVTIIPFAKSVGEDGGCVAGDASTFKPTDQIVDFYVDTLTSTSGRFRVNFEDVEQGADHDMDAIMIYEYQVVGSTVQITVTSEYAAGCIIQHAGYVISGTTADGTYLVVRDLDTSSTVDVDYALDTPQATAAASDPLPLTDTRSFSVGTGATGAFLKDPLWYAAKWGGYTDASTSADNIPNVTSEWDENNDGKPDNYFLVTNALTLQQKLEEAFTEILERVASGSAASVNSGSISSDSALFQAKFDARNWTGQLLAYRINANGTLGTSPLWDAAHSTKLPAPNARNIITVNSDKTPVPFLWPTGGASTGLDSVRKLQLDNAGATGFGNTTLQQQRIAFLRGDGAREGANVTDTPRFRVRPTKLGDFINSAPVFVGRPVLTYRDSIAPSAYSTFKSDNATRTGVVYVGGNDGMLHAFNSTTGVELFGFIPSPVFKNLKLLSDVNYSHRYYVDGSPTVADAYFHSGWKTVLVGGLNKGGQGIYALNITNPSNFSESNAKYSSSTQNGLVMWEFTDQDDADLGYTFSQPLVVPVVGATAGTTRWVAIFGNGYNNRENDGNRSSTGRAVLFVVDLATGTLLKKIDTVTGSTTTPNGLATPTAADLDGDNLVETVYAGDLRGNMWKFDLSATDATTWRIPYGTTSAPEPLFTAKDASNNAQPITSQARVVRGQNSSGAIVLFGTGKFLESADRSDTSVQTLYGIYDSYGNTSSDQVSGRSVLTQQTILTETSGTFGSNTASVRITSNNPISGTSRGWYLDLKVGSSALGERVISNPRVRNGRALFVTIEGGGTDPCVSGGKTRLMQVDMITGGRLTEPAFDLNEDGSFDNSDQIDVTISGTTQRVAPTGVSLDITFGQSPGIISGNNADYYYISGTSPPESTTPTTPNACLDGGDDVCGMRGSPGDNARGRQSWRQIR